MLEVWSELDAPTGTENKEWGISDGQLLRSLLVASPVPAASASCMLLPQIKWMRGDEVIHDPCHTRERREREDREPDDGSVIQTHLREESDNPVLSEPAGGSQR